MYAYATRDMATFLQSVLEGNVVVVIVNDEASFYCNEEYCYSNLRAIGGNITSMEYRGMLLLL